MTEKELVQNVKDEVERKIQALDFIDNIKKEMGDFRLWRPMADCPYWGKIASYHIINCYLEREKEKSKHCCILNPTNFCKYQLKKNGRF